MNNEWGSVDTFWVKIYIAGDIHVAKQVCREECFREGLCVTIEPCDYIYTGGAEGGYVVGLINYPRFPSSEECLIERAKKLAMLLVDRGFQHSCTIMNPHKTEFYSRRK